MSSELIVPALNKVYTFDGLLETSDPESTCESAKAPFAYRILSGGARYDAQGWVPPELLDRSATTIPKAAFTLLTTDSDAGETLILVAARPESSIEVLPHLPPDLCPIAGVVDRANTVIDGIAALPLRRFVNDVFTLRDVCFDFWRCPGSLAHHHAYPGGLAEHSVEVAELLAANGKLRETERDIGIVYALFHDVGKLWSYSESGHLNKRARRLGHEIVCLSKLRAAFVMLDREWEDASTALQSLLSGLWKRGDNRPLMAVAQVVRAFDQMSAERERGQSAPLAQIPWSPAPWRDAKVANEPLFEFI